jgi:hypothetical protein
MTVISTGAVPPAENADLKKLVGLKKGAFGFVLAVSGVLQPKLLRVTWKAIQEQRAEMATQTGILKESVYGCWPKQPHSSPRDEVLPGMQGMGLWKRESSLVGNPGK